MAEEITEKRRIEGIKKALNNPMIAALIIIILCALLLRIYYFYHTPDQTLWWDEAEYMSTAKHWSADVPYDLNPQRPPLFQALAAIFFSIGLGELSIRFFLTLLPSVFLVYAFYLLGKEMYDKKTGLIAAFLAAFSWTFVFWANRVQPDFLSMSFQVLSILFMWKFWKRDGANGTKSIMLSGMFAALGFYFKISALLVPMIFMVFIAIKDRFAAFKNKNYYYFSAAFLATLVPYFIWAFINFGNILAFRKGYVDAPTDFPIGWYNLKFFYMLTDNILFVLLIIGVIIGLRFLLYMDVLAKDKTKCFSPEIFSIVSILFISAFYIFYQRNTDDRWVFLWLPFIFMLAGKTIERIRGFLAKYNKILAICAVILIMGLIAYAQFTHAAKLIDMKKDSYSPVKDASLWMKAHTEEGDGIFSVSYTQTVYYTERNVTTYSLVPQLPDAAAFDEMVLSDRPKYVMWSIFETHPKYITDWMNQHIQKQDVKIVYANFADAQQTQPILLIFEIDYSKFK